MRFKLVLLLSAVGLFAQTPPPERFTTWQLVGIKSDLATPRYEYTVWNGLDDAFMGFSTKPVRVRLNRKVKAYVDEPKFIYIIDDAGEVRQLRYALQMEMRRKR